MIPGWPYSFVAALEPGRTSWTTLLDVVCLNPCDDTTEVTATQVRNVIERLRQAGHWRKGIRLAFLLAGLPVQLTGPTSPGSRVLLTATVTGTRRYRAPPKHGRKFTLADPATRPKPDAVTVTGTSRYGTVRACAWNGLRPRLTHRGSWAEQTAHCPSSPAASSSFRCSGFPVTATRTAVAAVLPPEIK